MTAKIFKRLILPLVIITVLAFGVVVYTTAQSTPKVCGDGIVQRPNDNGDNEKCDSGDPDNGNDTCTPACGDKLLGWAWSDTFGWLSLNSNNCKQDVGGNYIYLDPSLPTNLCTFPASVDYYTQIDVDNSLLGYGWVPSIGSYVCFGETCNELPSQFLGAAPLGGWSAIVGEEVENPQVVGWAKVVSLIDEGWISLNGTSAQCAGLPSCEGPDYFSVITKGSFNIISAKTLNGWGWNGNTSGIPGSTYYGLGWIRFNPGIGEVFPWLQTKYGDIYSRGNISGPELPFNDAFNATYRILAGGAIEGFRSSKQDEVSFEWVSRNFGQIDFPIPETRFSNVLGGLDFVSLLCDLSSAASCKNKLGHTVVKVDDLSDLPSILDGNVYYSNGSLIIDNPLTFNNAAGFDSGAGTIIIDGDLIINGNIEYGTGAAERFKNLASVAWLVRGDIRISQSVDQADGNYVALGNGTITSPNNCSDSIEVPGCGQIYSCYEGDPVSCQDNRLNVSGLMMARKFYFDRSFVDNATQAVVQGSELIIYDGRLLGNTPPGLQDFSKALPIWRSGTFEQ